MGGMGGSSLEFESVEADNCSPCGMFERGRACDRDYPLLSVRGRGGDPPPDLPLPWCAFFDLYNWCQISVVKVTKLC